MNKKYLKYIFLFIYYFTCLTTIYFVFRMDAYNNYLFSYGTVTGSIPYIDFNQIVPLFGTFIYSILLVLNHSILVFYLEQTILLLIMTYLLFKLLDNKAWIAIVLLFLPIVIPFSYCLFPGYNFLLLFELILLLYLNKYYQNDKLIGIVSGITIITKHNIGIFIFLVSLLSSIKDKKKLINRFVFGIIPGSIFIVILLLYGNLYEFIDLCLLGTSDFINNITFNSMYIIILVISIIIIFIKYIKDNNKNISYYYLIVYLLVTFPLFDAYHISLFLFFGLIVFLYNSNFDIKIKHIPIISFIIINIFIIGWVLINFNTYNRFRLYSYKNYEIVLLEPKEKKRIDQLNKYLKNKNYTIMSDPAKVVFLLTSNNQKIIKCMLLFRGNFGHEGTKKVLKEINSKKDFYFVIDTSVTCKKEKSCQYIEEVPEYIINNYQLVKEIDYYKIYYKK